MLQWEHANTGGAPDRKWSYSQSLSSPSLKLSRVVITPTVSSLVITVTSSWARWRFKSLASRLFTQLFVQAHIKENIKAPRHWPLCGEFTGFTSEFPAQRASNAENVSIWWRHHVGTESDIHPWGHLRLLRVFIVSMNYEQVFNCAWIFS